MRFFIFALALGLMLFLAGCTSQPTKPANNTTMSCNEYCVTQPHAQCAGDWKISGTYPNCVCNFECRATPPPTAPPPTTPPAAPPPSPPPNPPPPTNVTPPPAPPPPAEKVIEVTAQRFHFTPSTITVKKGEPVKLLITSQDATHGFSLPAFGISKTLPPGQTVTVEFVPDKAGSFPFACNVFCGSGHSGMSGTLIVQE